MTYTVEDWISNFYELNPDAASVEEKAKSPYLMDIYNKVLPALDKCDKGFYGRHTVEQRREIEKSMWVLMRLMSSSKNYPEHHISMVNDLVNVHFSTYARNVRSGKEGHAELLWKLMALCGSGKRQTHERIPSPIRVKKNRKESAVLSIFPLLKDSDLELFLRINTNEDLIEMFKDNGLDDAAIDEIFKNDTKAK